MTEASNLNLTQTSKATENSFLRGLRGLHLFCHLVFAPAFGKKDSSDVWINPALRVPGLDLSGIRLASIKDGDPRETVYNEVLLTNLTMVAVLSVADGREYRLAAPRSGWSNTFSTEQLRDHDGSYEPLSGPAVKRLYDAIDSGLEDRLTRTSGHHKASEDGSGTAKGGKRMCPTFRLKAPLMDALVRRFETYVCDNLKGLESRVFGRHSAQRGVGQVWISDEEAKNNSKGTASDTDDDEKHQQGRQRYFYTRTQMVGRLRVKTKVEAMERRIDAINLQIVRTSFELDLAALASAGDVYFEEKQAVREAAYERFKARYGDDIPACLPIDGAMRAFRLTKHRFIPSTVADVVVPQRTLLAEVGDTRIHNNNGEGGVRDNGGRKEELPIAYQLASLLTEPRTISVSSNQFTYKRIFSGNLRTGGRWYANFQTWRSFMRKTLLINGEPTVEVDYSGFHPRLLMHLEGVSLEGDPYALLGLTKDERPAAKVAMQALLNSTSRPQAEASIRAWRKHADAGQYERAFFLPERYCRTNSEDYAKFIDDVLKAFEPIYEKFFNAPWRELQRLDGDMTEYIMQTLWSEGIPVVSIHDSYVVPQRHEERLRDVMRIAYRKYGGVEFDPVLKMSTTHSRIQRAPRRK